MQKNITPTTVASPEDLTTQVRRLFWDRPLEPDDIDAYSQWVIKRVLDYGDLPDVRAVLHYFGRERFFEFVAEIRFDSIRTERFWRQFIIT